MFRSNCFGLHRRWAALSLAVIALAAWQAGTLLAAETAPGWAAPTTFGIDIRQAAWQFAPQTPTPLGHAMHTQDGEYSGVTHNLHFCHPMLLESPSPDTKIHVAYAHSHADDVGVKVNGHQLEVELEYAFNPFISVAIEAPYGFLEPQGGVRKSGWDNLSLAVKLANFAWAEHGILTSYGLEVSLPTGDDNNGIGSDHIVTYEPFFLVGWRREAVQVIAGVSLGLPTHQSTGEEVENEMETGLAITYLLTDSLYLVGELQAEIPLTGAESGHVVVNLTPEIQLMPIAGQPLMLGAAASFPMSEERGYEYALRLAVFYHLN